MYTAVKNRFLSHDMYRTGMVISIGKVWAMTTQRLKCLSQCLVANSIFHILRQGHEVMGMW